VGEPENAEPIPEDVTAPTEDEPLDEEPEEDAAY
jgi:hypothetical protein